MNKTKFLTFADFGIVGLRCDKGTVAIVLSPERLILKGKKPSNITFGGKNGRPVLSQWPIMGL